MGQQLERCAAVWIVTIVQDFARDLFGLAVFAFGDALLGQLTPLSQKPLTASSCCVAGRDRIGQELTATRNSSCARAKSFASMRRLAARQRCVARGIASWRRCTSRSAIQLNVLRETVALNHHKNRCEHYQKL